MQAKKTNPEKTKNPEMLTLDSTSRIGNRSFMVIDYFVIWTARRDVV